MIRAISEFESDILALANRLRAVPIGEIATYVDLDAVIGRDCRARRYLLITARDRVEREDGAVFASVFNVGIKRLPAEAFASVGANSRKAIRQKARVASKRMGNGLAKTNDVPAEVLRAVSREQSVLGLIQFAARDSTMAKMLGDEQLTAPTPIAVAARQLLRALGADAPNGG